MRKVTVIIEKSPDLFSAYVPNDIRSTFVNGQGKSIAEAIASLKEAISEAIESYIEDGQAVPDDLAGEIELVYKYDIASLFDYFDEINLSSFARKNGINESLLRKYRNRLAYASEKQCRKIEAGLHKLGAELCAASLLPTA
jgi:predicted RNase H-like HicB family nuclease